ncbi:unnamed protein product [Chrysoparadoxa australica]
MVRDGLVKRAIAFLQNPKVADSSDEKKRQFLLDKNLTAEEIDKAFSMAAEEAASAPPPPDQIIHRCLGGCSYRGVVYAQSAPSDTLEALFASMEESLKACCSSKDRILSAIVHTPPGKAAGVAEALLRWTGLEGSELLPVTCIPATQLTCFNMQVTAAGLRGVKESNNHH